MTAAEGQEVINIDLPPAPPAPSAPSAPSVNELLVNEAPISKTADFKHDAIINADHINLFTPVQADKKKIAVIPDTNILISDLYRIEAILYAYRSPGMLQQPLVGQTA